MATNILPSFSAAPSNAPWEPKYFVRYPFEGVEYCVGFDTLDEVMHTVTSKKDRCGKYLPTDVVNLIVDFAEESLEWNSCPPVAEAVTCEPCQCELCAKGHNSALVAELRSDMRWCERRVGWILVLIGAVALLV